MLHPALYHILLASTPKAFLRQSVVEFQPRCKKLLQLFAILFELHDEILLRLPLAKTTQALMHYIWITYLYM